MTTQQQSGGSASQTTDAVHLLLQEDAGLTRRDEPVAIGIPFPQGVLSDLQEWCLCDGGGERIPWQPRSLAEWPDGSVKWAHVFFFATIGPRESVDFHVRRGNAPLDRAVSVRREIDRVLVNTQTATFTIQDGGSRLLAAAEHEARSWLSAGGMQLISNVRGRSRTARIEGLEVEEDGPLRATIKIHGSLRNRTCLKFVTRLSFFVGHSMVRIETTIQNPSRARHRGGTWDLGDPGSVLLREVSLEIDTNLPPEREIHWLENGDGPEKSSQSSDWLIHQESSGGENWDSSNHFNRNREVPLRFRGYQVVDANSKSTGLRASPFVSLQSAGSQISCSLTEFWQKCPSSLQIDGERIRASIFSGQASDLHELQAGEHCTRVMWLDFSEGDFAPCRRLMWTHTALVPACSPAWYAQSRAIWCLPQPAQQVRTETRQLLDEALDGPTSLFAKREAIDEYGWRHFGDSWGDHEEAFCEAATRPVVSQYNNQYDALYGFLLQFLLSGDRRWWQLADPLARHVMDIDVYHTSHDKAAYNGGQFWHTAHYQDAGTSTHRSFSRSMRTAQGAVLGGGPGNENNYASGLLLYHYLTGDHRALDTVVSLAEWVVAMDSGDKHLLGIVSSAPTGLASCTAQFDYHGPGRGAGNSINVLLDGYQATGREDYLVNADDIIRRTIHPQDDLDARDLANAELRWSYTVYLQALVRYIELMRTLDRNDFMVRYALASLLHYARWMVLNERLYLDTPDDLEYPTETWAAQELRKGVVLLMAARYAEGEEKERMAQRGFGILDGGWQHLMRFETRSFTRPLMLVLQQCYFETYWGEAWEQLPSGDSAECDGDFGEPLKFVTHKQQIRAALKSPSGWVGLAGHAMRPAGWINAARRSWPCEAMRRLAATLRS